MMMSNTKPDRLNAAAIVHDVGGTLVGRTRLQKVAYLLELAGFGDGFRFEYRHYGPYCEELTNGIRMARAFGLVKEDERPTNWGGFYSIYMTSPEVGGHASGPRATFAKSAASIGAIELELLATAAFLHHEEGYKDPWAETARRKPEKAEGRLEKAKDAYIRLLRLETPKHLPKIA